jgi:hypothetical protein
MTILDFVALFATTILISKILLHYDVRLSRRELSLLFVAIVLVEVLTLTIQSGQKDILILLIITSIYYLLFVRGKSTFASLLVGIAAVIHIWPLILIFLDFLAHRKKKFLVKCCLVLGVLGVISLGLFGVSTHAACFAALKAHDNIPVVSLHDALGNSSWSDGNGSPINAIVKLASLFGLAQHYDIIIAVWSILKWVFVALVFAYLLYVSRTRLFSPTSASEILVFSLLVILPLIVANNTWMHYVTFLVLPYVLLIFVIPLSQTERIALLVSIILFSIDTPLEKLSNIFGAPLKSTVYALSPLMLAYVLFLFTILHMINSRTAKRDLQAASTEKLP